MADIKNITQVMMKNNQLYFSIMARELSKHGITIPQAFVIGEIYMKPKTMGELSKALDLSNSTVSGIIDRLERQNIVVRKRDEADRRVVRVSLSQDIEELGKQYPVLKEDYFAQMFSSIREKATDEQLDQLYSSLQFLQDFLQKLADKD